MGFSGYILIRLYLTDNKQRDICMHFYVDETGHTGPNLFDQTQPVLSYGVLSSPEDLDKVAEKELAALRKALRVPRLHAAELGMHRLGDLVDTLLVLQKKHRIRFDIYQVVKRDHAIISFFDQVFDQGMNPAVSWTSYWTPHALSTATKSRKPV